MGMAPARLSCLVVRLGWLGFRQNGRWDPEEPSWGLSEVDCAQLLLKCVEAFDGLGFAILHGVSEHRRSWLSLEATKHAVDLGRGRVVALYCCSSTLYQIR